MENFFKKPNEKLLELKNLDRDTLLYQVMPHMLMEIVKKYFRLEVEGMEHVPRKGPGLLVPNHSGYSGFDALVLVDEIHSQTKRIPRVLMHHLWFLNKLTAIPAKKLGFVEATKGQGLRMLKKKQLVVLFPEGEHGNFKPTSKRYHIQKFKRGFVRMALETKTPIIPVVIIGAEETHINLRKLKFTKNLFGSVLPLPLNILPLPAKWKIKFLPPMLLPYHPSAASDTELVHEISSDIRERMQTELSRELGKRKFIFFESKGD